MHSHYSRTLTLTLTVTLPTHPHMLHTPHIFHTYGILYHISHMHIVHSHYTLFTHTTHSPHSDGQKMSKRLKNYPDPMAVVHKFGADALRLYLINSPVVRAETLKFKESGVKDVVKDVFLPWFNAYRFLLQNIDTLKQVCV